VLPLVTLLENIAGLYLSLVQGAEIMLYPMAQIGFTGLSSLDEKRFFATIDRLQPESMIMVPELLRLLMLGVSRNVVDPKTFNFIAVGGGKVSETLLQQAESLGLPVLQGYGLSECASVVSLNGLQNDRPGSVGRPLQHVCIKIASDGEILVAGNVMLGYLGDSSSAGDWLATGDLGYLDEDGYLYVTGRKKNLLVTAFGKNISPEWVESIFLQTPLIRQVLVTGDADTRLRAVIVPAAPVGDEQLAAVIAELNGELPEYARVQDYQVSTTPFLFENGFLTANGRLKRDAISNHYA
jgi:acyl-CoA synthetase (AMP-forming)/AMP-acid ligase II